MNTRIQNTSLLIAASLGSLLFTVSAGATAANRKAIEVNTGNSGEAASSQDKYLIAQVSSCTVQDPSGTPLNVRDNPNGRRVVDSLKNGTQVTAVNSQQDGKRNTWSLIIPDQGKNGWVLSSSISCGNPMGSACTVQDPTGKPTNIRPNPNSNGAPLGTLRNGDTVTGMEDLSSDKKWRLVFSKAGVKGWVFAQYLKCS